MEKLELDSIAIELVAYDGHRMPLKKQERLEAIRIMARHGVSRAVIAWRLHITVNNLELISRNARISLPRLKPPAHWTMNYIDKREKGQPRYRPHRKKDTNA